MLTGARTENREQGCLINLSAWYRRCLCTFDFGDDVASFETKLCRRAVWNNCGDREATGLRERRKPKAKLRPGTALLSGFWGEQADMRDAKFTQGGVYNICKCRQGCRLIELTFLLFEKSRPLGKVHTGYKGTRANRLLEALQSALL